jgi:peptidoglycan hydrolase-like protein with peptidoglycan-binding domain
MAVIRQPKVNAARNAVSGKAKDDVFLSRCVYKSTVTRKSLTVHHVQRRLIELGYTRVVADKDGWYGDATRDAVAMYQATIDIEPTGVMDAATFKAIFAGDESVVVDLN